MARMRLRTIFAKNLRRLRLEAQLSQEALADEAGLDRSYIGSLERECYSASLDTVEKLAIALGIPAQQLFAIPRDERPSCQD